MPFAGRRRPDGGDASQERNLGAAHFLCSTLPVGGPLPPPPQSRPGGREPPPGPLPEPEVTR
ncbi:hypothetical protein GCM10009613_31340 [Pseudonocardia kongjuensis]|uniref:Uncharacterized protein n=1 Tax=Pseudonocardia kongjuensis TaxID=102227 RepID=A0ABN1XUD9_9PSEU